MWPNNLCCSNVMPKSKKSKDQEDSDSDSDDLDDLDDEEVSLGSMDDFEDECEDEGGEFMQTEEDVDDEAGVSKPQFSLSSLTKTSVIS